MLKTRFANPIYVQELAPAIPSRRRPSNTPKTTGSKGTLARSTGTR